MLPVKPLFLRMRILDAKFAAIADADYRLEIEGDPTPRTGKTDGNGQLEEQVPIDAKTARLSIRVPSDAADEGPPPATPSDDLAGELPIAWDLKIADLNPIMENAPDTYCISGVQARLNNLALNAGPVDGIRGPNTKAAIAAFQRTHGLVQDEIPGQGETQPKLRDVHDKPDSIVPPPPPPAPTP